MKNFLQSNKNIIIVVIFLIVAFIAYKYLVPSSTPTSALNTSVVSAGADVVALSNSIKSATLDDGALVNSSEYMSLKDFSTTITMQPIGRVNPFSPIGSETGQIISAPTTPIGSTKTTTTTTTTTKP